MLTLQSLSDDGASWIGQRIGNYQLVRLLGAGGMGMVFEAVHVTAGGQAAIKILRSEVAVRQDIVVRFFNEARAANSISHPSIVSVFDCGYTANGSAYLAMEFLSGDTLQKRLSRSPQLEIGNSLQIARQLASALNSAHRCHVIHRDLKPENIMLVPDLELSGGERVKILDFGIAKVAEQLGGDLIRTRTGMFMGTPTYMAPEQCRGAKHVTDKSDVYSLGIILYQMLAGKPPFVGDSIGELIAMHLTDEPVPLAEVVPHMEPQLTALVHAMLEKKASARPDMEAVLRALQQQLESHAVALVPQAVREGITLTATPAAQIHTDSIAASERPTLDSRSREHPVAENNAIRQTPQSEPVGTSHVRMHPPAPPTAPLTHLHIEAPVEPQPPTASDQQSIPFLLSEKLASDGRTPVGTTSTARQRGELDSRFWLGTAGLIGLSLIIIASVSHLRRHPARPSAAALTKAQTTPQTATPGVSPLALKAQQDKVSVGLPTLMVSAPNAAPTKQVASDANVPSAERETMVTAASGSPGSQPQPDQVALIQQGRKKLDAREPAAAAVLFSRAVQLDAGSAEAIGGLGESNFRQGKFDVAASQLAAAVNLAPQGPLTYQELLAQALYKTGRYKVSAEVCRRLLKQAPTSVKAKQTLKLAEKELALAADIQTLSEAQVEYDNGNFAKAIEKSQKVVQRYPIKAWRIIGVSACNIKAINLANDAFKRLDTSGKQFLTYVCQQHNIQHAMDGLRLIN